MNDTPAERISRPTFLDTPAVAAVLAALPGARAVGGCVRDALAGRAIADIDIAAPLPPEAIATRLRNAGLKVFETGMSHGTVTAVLDHAPVEVTALRRDVLTDGRHATVAWTTDWREDAARRDFTINAMSLAPDGALFDYFTGRADLAAGRVRFVGDPDTRLAEDYLRALRFFRFQARYGVGEPDAAAVAAIRRAVPGLARLSPERVWMELKRILSVPDPVAAVGLMAQTGVLGAVLPEVAGPPAPGGENAPDLSRLGRLVAMGAPADALLRLAAMIRGPLMVDGIQGRLRLSGAERDALDFLTGAVEGPTPGAPPPMLDAWRALHSEVAAEVQARRLWLEDASEGDVAARTTLRHRLRDEPAPSFPLRGRDVVAAGIEPGPRVSSLLRSIEAWWIEGGCTASRDECLAELARHIAAAGPGAAPADERGKPDDTGTGGGDGTALGG